MNRTGSKTKQGRALTAAHVLALSVAAVSASAAVIAAENGTLFINGKVASTEMRTIGGSAYVRVNDVAKALGMVVVRRADGGYELTKTGGANQVEGIQGKGGDTLFTGQWRVTVLSVETPVDSYAMKSQGDPYGNDLPTDYNSATRVIRPKPGYTLVVVRCRVTNGQKSPQSLWIARTDTNTALADGQGESYPPYAYDVDGAPIQTKPLLPGAKLDLPIIFVVPQGAQLKDFVFTANNNDATKSRKGNDVRVHLR